MICPHCRGNKGVRALVCFADGTSHVDWHPCGVCSGTGEIDQQQAERINTADLHRLARIGRNQTVKDLAKALKLDFNELQDWEHGRVQGERYGEILALVEEQG